MRFLFSKTKRRNWIKSFKTHSFAVRVVAGVIGLTAMATDSWMNIEFALETEKSFTSLVFAVCVVGFAAAAALPFMERAWKEREMMRWAGFGLLFVVLTGFSLSASIHRSGASRDTLLAQKRTENMAFTLASNAFEKAKKDRALINGLKLKECATGRGAKCKSWEKAVLEAGREVVKTRDALKNAGSPVVEDSMAKRLAVMLPFTEAQIQTYQPMLLPFGLQLAGLLFLGLAFAPEKDAPKIKAKPAKKDGVGTVADEVLWIEAMKEAANSDRHAKIIFDAEGLLKAPYKCLADVWEVKSTSTVSKRIARLCELGYLETQGGQKNKRYRMVQPA